MYIAEINETNDVPCDITVDQFSTKNYLLTNALQCVTKKTPLSCAHRSVRRQDFLNHKSFIYFSVLSGRHMI